MTDMTAEEIQRQVYEAVDRHFATGGDVSDLTPVIECLRRIVRDTRPERKERSYAAAMAKRPVLDQEFILDALRAVTVGGEKVRSKGGFEICSNYLEHQGSFVRSVMYTV